jgi:hypothetical protein
MKHISKAATITLAALVASASAVAASDPAPNAHGVRVSDVARAADYASGRAHGAAVSAAAKTQGALRSAEARARAAAHAKDGKAKGVAASEPGRLKSEDAGS